MTKIKQIVYCGWRGVDYLALETDKPLNAFLGENGAGKSTLAMALIYALMPDRRILNIRPISDIKDPSVHSQDPLFERIDPEQGFAYVAFDMITRSDERLVAGINLVINNDRVNITSFSIHGLPKDYNLYAAFNIDDGSKVYTPQLAELRREMAQQGFDLRPYDRLGDYGKLLHDVGIIPTPMYNNEDRELYARLLETSFLGGISPEIAKNLKHYLLPEAKHIPETVRRMHECTEDVLKTQRALNDAKRQIRLIQAAFVTGRSLITNAVSYVLVQFRKQWSELESIRNELINHNVNEVRAKESIAKQTEEHEIVLDAEKHLKKVSHEKIALLEVERNAKFESRLAAAEALKHAKQELENARDGKKNWSIALAKCPSNYEYDQLETWLEQKLENIRERRSRKNEEVRILKAELEHLRGSEGDNKIAVIASHFSAKTLEEELAHLSESEALCYEAALHGMTNGIIGVSPGDIAGLRPGADMPDCFWIGENLPDIASLQTQGYWNFIPSLNGFTVLSDKYKATFGSEARRRRELQLEKDIARIKRLMAMKFNPIENDLKLRQKVLLKSSISIRFFLENMDGYKALEQRVENLGESVNALIKETQRIEHEVRIEREDQEKKTERYARQREQLKISMVNAENIISISLAGIQKLSVQRGILVRAIRERLTELRECKKFHSFHPFFKEIIATENFSDQAIYVSTQTKLYSALVKALETESPERIQPIATLEIDHHSPTQCLSIWPVLMDILHDHVPTTLLEGEGESLLQQMEDRRDNLFKDLVKKQNEVKVQARNISTSINTQINAQKRQVNALSEMGKNLRFGKVEGIRISLLPKVRMIEILQKVAEEGSLFSNEAESMDEVLARYFKEVLGMRLEGNELLDYRTFIDLKLEAKRSNGKDWVPAFSLSGGEAIGAGIAIVFMLFKALANRGDHRPDLLTPVFIMDEIHRIDARGQGMVVELCEQNGIQLFVTGPEMAPAQNTRMYILARSTDPAEVVIARELRGFAG